MTLNRLIGNYNRFIGRSMLRKVLSVVFFFCWRGEGKRDSRIMETIEELPCEDSSCHSLWVTVLLMESTF